MTLPSFRQAKKASAQVTKEYAYTNLSGCIVAYKYRYADKHFGWKTFNGKWERPKPWHYLYNWHNAQKFRTVWVVEGEKDVDTLKNYGVGAVSLSDGAKSKWCDEYTEFFRGKSVTIIPDNDKSGADYANMIYSNIKDIAQKVVVVDLSKIWENIPEKADITDYLEQGGDFMKVRELANKAEPYEPKEIKADKGITVLSELDLSNVNWLWYPYIPRGKITLLTADPGTGKTFFSLYLAAMVSTGRHFFGQSEADTRPPEKALYHTAEDGYSDTILPRLIPMQPKLENIGIINETEKALSFTDLERIENAMKFMKPALMVFDPLQAYLGAEVDMHRANEVRPVLSQLGMLAEKYDTAIILIMHNSKMAQNKALYRALGSIDIPAIARSILIMGKHPDNPNLKVVCHEKSSLAPHGKSFTFEIAPDRGGILFGDFTELTADQILDPKKGTRNKPNGCRNEAIDFLEMALEENGGYISYDEVKKLQEEIGCSKNTMYRARDELELQKVSAGFSGDKKAYWLFPDIDAKQFKANMENLDDFKEISIL